VISSSPFPQIDVSSNLVAPKMVTYNGGKGAKGKKQRPNLNLFLFILLSKILSIDSSFRFERKSLQKLYQNKHN
jgi:hypothetical protein